ncbi:hypothetical protein KPL74_01470 [Bacillus sp. NP157]|nr:hypothetical protein KPL74_01470 [Bacillus sp. NP157]
MANLFKPMKAARGIVLLDALIAILVFTFGILAIVALQASATKLSGDSKYRVDAALLANRFISGMWTADSSLLATDYVTGGTAYNKWFADTVDCTTAKVTSNCLPGITTALKPTVTIDANNLVTITLKWQAPQDTGPHQYISISQIQ